MLRMQLEQLLLQTMPLHQQILEFHIEHVHPFVIVENEKYYEDHSSNTIRYRD